MSFYGTWGAVFPEYDFRFNDTSTTNAFANTGSGFDLVDAGGVTFLQPFNTFAAATDYAVTFNGSTGTGGTSNPIPYTGATTGTFAIAFKASSSGSGSQRIYHQQDPTGSREIDCVILSSGYFYIAFQRTSTGTDRITYTYPVDMRDDEWHMIIIRQTGDSSTGIEFFLDSRFNPMSMTINDTAITVTQVDCWWNEVFQGTEVGSGTTHIASKKGTSGYYNGDIGLFGLDDAAISNANMDILFSYGGDAWSFDVFSNKNIRRRNRKLFFDYSTL